MTALISLVAFLVAISILVTFHEFGHFVVARLLGVKVLRFSVGFGKPLLRWQPRAGGTEYVIAPIPFGGYVKMLDEREGEVPESERRRAFNRQPLWRRAAILFAGPGFNILLAVIIYWIVFMTGIPGIKPVVGPVAPNSPAAAAGIAERATILAIDGKPAPTWQAVRLAMLDGVMLGKPLVLKLRQPEGGVVTRQLSYTDVKALTSPGGLLPGLGLSVWLPSTPPVLEKIEPGGAAAHAGLRSGDRVLSVNGQPVTGVQSLVKQIQAAPGQRLMLRVERDGRRFEVSVVPGEREQNGKRIGHIGAGVRLPDGALDSLQAEYRLAPLPALVSGAGRTGEVTAMTGAMLYRMARGEASLSNLSGPIGIAQAAGSLAEAGIVPYLLFLALISISLGILNLLPIPILDGGQLLYLVIEAVRRRPLSETAEAIGQRVGLSLLVVLIGFAVFNDLARILQS
ncbi:MAG: RIP metalloprotease RseP [Gammaproteobacteria bacterium]